MNKGNQGRCGRSDHTSVSSAQGLAVIGMFIKCPVYNRLRSPHVKPWKRMLVISSMMKTIAKAAVVASHLSLTEMISKLICLISFWTHFFDDKSWSIVLVCRGLYLKSALCVCILYTADEIVNLAASMFGIWCHHEGISGIKWTRNAFCWVFNDCAEGAKIVNRGDFSHLWRQCVCVCCRCCESVCMRLSPACAWVFVWFNRWVCSLMAE